MYYLPIPLVFSITHNISIPCHSVEAFEDMEGSWKEHWRDYIQFDRPRLLPIRHKEASMRLHNRAHSILLRSFHLLASGIAADMAKQNAHKIRKGHSATQWLLTTTYPKWRPNYICSSLLHLTCLLLALIQAITWPMGVFSVNCWLSGLFKHQWWKTWWFLPFILPHEPQRTGMEVLLLQANE